MGTVAAGDVFTASTTFMVMHSIRLDPAYGPRDQGRETATKDLGVWRAAGKRRPS